MMPATPCSRAAVLHPAVALPRPHRSRCGRDWRHLPAPRALEGEGEYAALREAAAYLADTYLASGQVVGLGTGVAVNCLLHELSERLADGRLQAVRCVPSSNASAGEAAFHGVPLTTLAEAGGEVDLVIDVASLLDVGPCGGLAYIVGRGQSGPQLGQPNLIALRQLLGAAHQCVVVAESEGDCTSRLAGSMPVLVEGDVWEEAGEELDDTFIGDADLWRRGTQADAGPRGGTSPVITPDGHQLLDLRFEDGLKLYGEPAPYEEIAAAIERVDGVVAHGLVVGAASAAVVAARDGPIGIRRSECVAAFGEGSE